MDQFHHLNVGTIGAAITIGAVFGYMDEIFQVMNRFLSINLQQLAGFTL